MAVLLLFVKLTNVYDYVHIFYRSADKKIPEMIMFSFLVAWEI